MARATTCHHRPQANSSTSCATTVGQLALEPSSSSTPCLYTQTTYVHVSTDHDNMTPLQPRTLLSLPTTTNTTQRCTCRPPHLYFEHMTYAYILKPLVQRFQLIRALFASFELQRPIHPHSLNIQIQSQLS